MENTTPKSEPEVAAKPKQKQLGKTKTELTARARIIIEEIVRGASEAEALKKAGYSKACINGDKMNILRNPVMQQTFSSVLEAEGVTDVKLAEKIRSLIDAKETKFFASKGIITDSREVDALAIQAQMVEFAAKLKGHVRSTPEGGGSGNTYIDLSCINFQLNQSGGEDKAVDAQAVDKCHLSTSLESEGQSIISRVEVK